VTGRGATGAAPDTRSLAAAPAVRAPDGSLLQPLCQIAGRGSFAHFRLEPGETARAVSHATVAEIWYVVGGRGTMWRRPKDGDPVTVDLEPGVCLTIPAGTAFQFRAHQGAGPLAVVAVTMPPWPADRDDEARPEQGPWAPEFRR
jgi:mannose-6-phosphate isomerase-like protein (cupin superfamily)